MTEERLQELERLEQAATPGPWEVANGKKRHFCLADCAIVGGTDTEYGLRCIAKCNDNFPEAFADARLITAARNALPALLAEVKRLRESNDSLRNALKVCMAEYVEEYGSASCDCDKPDCWVCMAVKALEDIHE